MFVLHLIGVFIRRKIWFLSGRTLCRTAWHPAGLLLTRLLEHVIPESHGRVGLSSLREVKAVRSEEAQIKLALKIVNQWDGHIPQEWLYHNCKVIAIVVHARPDKALSARLVLLHANGKFTSGLGTLRVGTARAETTMQHFAKRTLRQTWNLTDVEHGDHINKGFGLLGMKQVQSLLDVVNKHVWIVERQVLARVASIVTSDKESNQLPLVQVVDSPGALEIVNQSSGLLGHVRGHIARHGHVQVVARVQILQENSASASRKTLEILIILLQHIRQSNNATLQVGITTNAPRLTTILDQKLKDVGSFAADCCR